MLDKLPHALALIQSGSAEFPVSVVMEMGSVDPAQALGSALNSERLQCYALAESSSVRHLWLYVKKTNDVHD